MAKKGKKASKASPALRKALKRHGLEGLIKNYPDEWSKAHQIELDPAMDPMERVKRIVETFLTMVEERLKEEYLEKAYPDLKP